MFDVQATSYYTLAVGRDVSNSRCSVLYKSFWHFHSTQYDEQMYVCEMCYNMLFTTDVIQPISPSSPWYYTGLQGVQTNY